MIRLKITCRGAEEEAVFYDEEVITAGRSSKNNLQIPDNQASRKHFLIEKGDKSYKIVDLGSRNGTRVNGKKRETHELQKGDKIRTGEATIIVKDISFPSAKSGASDKKGVAGKRPAPAKRPLKKVRRGEGGINIRRGRMEMPMGLFDYLLVLAIIVLVFYIAGLLLTIAKTRGMTEEIKQKSEELWKK